MTAHRGRRWSLLMPLKVPSPIHLVFCLRKSQPHIIVPVLKRLGLRLHIIS